MKKLAVVFLVFVMVIMVSTELFSQDILLKYKVPDSPIKYT